MTTSSTRNRLFSQLMEVSQELRLLPLSKRSSYPVHPPYRLWTKSERIRVILGHSRNQDLLWKWQIKSSTQFLWMPMLQTEQKRHRGTLIKLCFPYYSRIEAVLLKCRCFLSVKKMWGGQLTFNHIKFLSSNKSLWILFQKHNTDHGSRKIHALPQCKECEMRRRTKFTSPIKTNSFMKSWIALWQKLTCLMF